MAQTPSVHGASRGRVSVSVAVVGILVLLLVLAASIHVHRGGLVGPFVVGETYADSIRDLGLRVDRPVAGPGYDGEFYLRLALDPSPADGSGLDLPRYRSRRILWPALSWASGLGRPHAVLISLYFWLIALSALGTWALAEWCRAGGASPWWGLCFVLQFGVLVSSWRMAGDGIFCALTISTLLAFERCWRFRGTALASTMLQKELGLLLLPALVLRAVGKAKRGLLQLIVATAVAVGWWSIVASALLHAPRERLAVNFDFPGRGFGQAVIAALGRDSGVMRLAKDLGLLGIHGLAVVVGLSLGLAAWRRWRRGGGIGLASASAGVYALVCVCLSYEVWGEPWSFGRALLPLIVLDFMAAFENGPVAAAVPTDRWLRRWAAIPAVLSALAFFPYLTAIVKLGRP